MSRLSANAEPFVPRARSAQQRTQRAPDQQSDSALRNKRSLFVTFSKGSPLTRDEIRQHFTNEYGECVEYVYVHDRHNNERRNRGPQFGRIIFTTIELPDMIMGNDERVKVLIRDKPLWLKKYVPYYRRTMAKDN